MHLSTWNQEQKLVVCKKLNSFQIVELNLKHPLLLFQLSTRQIYSKNITIFATVVCISVNCVWDMTTNIFKLLHKIEL